MSGTVQGIVLELAVLDVRPGQTDEFEVAFPVPTVEHYEPVVAIG